MSAVPADNRPNARPVLLEVIVTSVHEAIEAQAGGADRLELVDSLAHGGLTPAFRLTEDIIRAVSIPVRVMLRPNASMSISEPGELSRLRLCAAAFASLGVHGIVLGFLRDGALDYSAMEQILDAAAGTPVTFHRAFDHVEDQALTLEQLKRFPQIDRILTDGGRGGWQRRKNCVAKWQRAAAPEITMIFANGRETTRLPELRGNGIIREVHVGRAARVPNSHSGVVTRSQVAELKNLLAANGTRESHPPR